MLILSATRAFAEQTSSSESRLLMEQDSTKSLIMVDQGDAPKPADLQRYQDKYITSLDMTASSESGWLPAISSVTSSQCERLLERWTSLPQFDDRLKDAEREAQKQRQEHQQPTVESDSEEDLKSRSNLSSRRSSRRSGSVQPLFTDPIQPMPVSENKYGPTAPMSPAASPRTSRSSVATAENDLYASTSPRSSIGSLPVEAAAAVEAKEEDDDVDLEIPWTLCARKFYWKYIDAKQVDTNTDQAPSLAFLERNSWTEILASWVCKEAIREAGLRYTPVQKDRKDGRRTKLETLFMIEKPLQFDEVKRLVERTVEIYRRTAPPTPPPQIRRSSFNRPPPQVPRLNGIDRDRTPVPRNTHPPLERSSSSMHFAPPPGPPPLDRSLSTPGPGLTPSYPRTPNLQIPMPPGPYIPNLPPRPRSPHIPQYPPHPISSSSYNPPPMYPSSPQHYAYPPSPQTYSISLPPHLQPPSSYVPQSPLRQTHLHPFNGSARFDDTTTSESESGERERARRQRSKSRSRGEKGRRKGHRTSKAAGALLGVGGLTALLDGLGGL